MHRFSRGDFHGAAIDDRNACHDPGQPDRPAGGQPGRGAVPDGGDSQSAAVSVPVYGLDPEAVFQKASPFWGDWAALRHPEGGRDPSAPRFAGGLPCRGCLHCPSGKPGRAAKAGRRDTSRLLQSAGACLSVRPGGPAVFEWLGRSGPVGAGTAERLGSFPNSSGQERTGGGGTGGVCRPNRPGRGGHGENLHNGDPFSGGAEFFAHLSSAGRRCIGGGRGPVGADKRLLPFAECSVRTGPFPSGGRAHCLWRGLRGAPDRPGLPEAAFAGLLAGKDAPDSICTALWLAAAA